MKWNIILALIMSQTVLVASGSFVFLFGFKNIFKSDLSIGGKKIIVIDLEDAMPTAKFGTLLHLRHEGEEILSLSRAQVRQGLGAFLPEVLAGTSNEIDVSVEGAFDMARGSGRCHCCDGRIVR